MNATTLNGNSRARRSSVPGSERRSLLKLYLVRGLLAVAWAVAFAGVHDALGGVAIALLVVYPLIDAMSSLVDYRTVTRGPERTVTAFNAVLSAVAAVAMGVAGASGVAAALAVFGAWAALSGAAQLVAGLRRRGPELGRQWPMLIAGSLSFLVGILYVIQAAGDRPSLQMLSIYATGGGMFFIAQAALLAWRARQPRFRSA